MNLINAQVGIKRIQTFLEKDEMASVEKGDSSGEPKSFDRLSKLPLLDVRAGADALILASEGGHIVKTIVADACWDGDGNSRVSERDDDMAVLLRNGFFSWGSGEKEKVVLRHINLRIRKGQLVMVVGEVNALNSNERAWTKLQQLQSTIMLIDLVRFVSTNHLLSGLYQPTICYHSSGWVWQVVPTSGPVGGDEPTGSRWQCLR